MPSFWKSNAWAVRGLLSCGVLAVALTMLSGCLVKRSIVRVEDHPRSNSTIMETVDVYSWFPLMGYRVHHQFWLCTDSSKGLQCDRSCDGASDLTCPASGVVGPGAGMIPAARSTSHAGR